MYNRKIVGYAHDRDSSVTAYTKKNWQIREYVDRNHSVKCLAKYFKMFVILKNEFFTHFHNFIYFLISYSVIPLKKVDLWENASKHYTGHQEKCIKHKLSLYVLEYANKDIAISTLEAFFDRTSFIFNAKHHFQHNLMNVIILLDHTF